MKSIRIKYLTLILCCVLVTNIIIVVIGVQNAKSILNEDSAMILDLQCTKGANEIDYMLDSISRSVEQIGDFALEQCGDLQELQENPQAYQDYVEIVHEIAVNTAEATDGAVAVYLRFNQDLFTPTAGFFEVRSSNDSGFAEHETTDLSLYDQDDIGHVGWYYLPFEKGEKLWMEPYLNENIGVYMISYVVPLYVEDTPFAVVGIDIDLSLLQKKMSQMTVYDSGYGFLWSAGGELIYHPDYPEGMGRGQFPSKLEKVRRLSNKAKTQDVPYIYSWEGEQKYLRSKQLSNGMTFSICVSEREIDGPVHRFQRTSVIVLVILLTAAVIFAVCITGVMVRPLRQITESARKMIDGDLDVDIRYKSKDEMGVLAESFRQMAHKMKEQLVYIKNLAYYDSLTGVKNKTAYEEVVSQLEDHMRAKEAMFAVVVMDINNLKHINDNYGHELGDRLISDGISIMKKIFPKERLFRIGGDEFVALLSAAEIPLCRNWLIDFQMEIESFNKTRRAYPEELHVAAGAAVYDEERDKTYTSVFRRADARMYKDKTEQKLKQKEKASDGGAVR